MPATTITQDRAVATWLFLCCVLVFAMVILGGVTRLTGSGLSMVEWDPIFGILPPLSAAEWARVFSLYRQSPEFLHINVGMDLAGFQSIYWFEYAHRVLGRSIGTAFLLPFLYFLWRRRIPRHLVPKLIGLFVLGGLQGLMGWYMVMSGLVDEPHVSQYRLTAHLLLAFVIYAYMLWLALDLWSADQPASGRGPLRTAALGLAALTLITVVSGGFVAGLKAGFAYNTFPLMDGRWVPEVILLQQPWWKNFFENIATVQFDHRLLATLTLAASLALWWRGQRLGVRGRAGVALHLMLVAVLLQVGLGIATLLLHVPVPLAATHQGGAMVLFSTVLLLNHALRRQQA